MLKRLVTARAGLFFGLPVSKLPYFPCYVRDVLSSNKITLMSGDAFKAYWYLLCESWIEDERATLPNEQAKGKANGQSNLQALARVSPEVWLEIKNEVLACFETGDNGRIYNERLKKISDTLYERAKAGSKGGSKTQAKRKAKLEANDDQSGEHASANANNISNSYLLLSKSFHSKQRKNFPNHSVLRKEPERLDEDGAIELEKFERIDGWSQSKIEETLQRILNDDKWCKNVISLRTIRNRGKNGSMKFENADTYAAPLLSDAQIAEGYERDRSAAEQEIYRRKREQEEEEAASPEIAGKHLGNAIKVVKEHMKGEDGEEVS